MASISIDDLEENHELDEAAMRAVFGGRRSFAERASELSLRLAAGPQLDESSLVPGLVKTQDLRMLPDD